MNDFKLLFLLAVAASCKAFNVFGRNLLYKANRNDLDRNNNGQDMNSGLANLRTVNPNYYGPHVPMTNMYNRPNYATNGYVIFYVPVNGYPPASPFSSGVPKGGSLCGGYPLNFYSGVPNWICPNGASPNGAGLYSGVTNGARPNGVPFNWANFNSFGPSGPNGAVPNSLGPNKVDLNGAGVPYDVGPNKAVPIWNASNAVDPNGTGGAYNSVPNGVGPNDDAPIWGISDGVSPKGAVSSQDGISTEASPNKDTANWSNLNGSKTNVPNDVGGNGVSPNKAGRQTGFWGQANGNGRVQGQPNGAIFDFGNFKGTVPGEVTGKTQGKFTTVGRIRG